MWNRTRARPIEFIVRASPLRMAVWRGFDPSRAPRIPDDFGAIVRADRLAGLFERVGALEGAVIAAVEGTELRGYATLVPSPALAGERWENLPATFELGSMEVARSHRSRGIGGQLLAHIGTALPVERLLLFARGIASHWDLSRTAAEPLAHRRMLLRMLGRAGFQRWDTDDADIGEDALNFLAVRAGPDVPAEALVTMMERARGRFDTGG